MVDGPTLYDVHALGISAQTKPRDLAEVARALQLIERWGNTIPWWPPASTVATLASGQTVTAAVSTAIPGLAMVITPTRVGQVIVGFVHVEANRTVGASGLALDLLINNVPTGYFWYAQGAGGNIEGMFTTTATSLADVVIQMRGLTGGGTTWAINSPASRITVLTV